MIKQITILCGGGYIGRHRSHTIWSLVLKIFTPPTQYGHVCEIGSIFDPLSQSKNGNIVWEGSKKSRGQVGNPKSRRPNDPLTPNDLEHPVDTFI